MLIEEHVNELLRDRIPTMTESLGKRFMELRKAQNELGAIAVALNRHVGYSLHPGQLDHIVQRMHRALNEA